MLLCCLFAVFVLFYVVDFVVLMCVGFVVVVCLALFVVDRFVFGFDLCCFCCLM